jgi:glycosyltransferase involved in cell wall biosynthesis
MDLTAVGERCLPRSTVSTLCMSAALVLLTPRQGEYLRREEGVGRHPWSRTREAVIPNGIVIPPLPGPDARRSARVDLGLDDDDFVVGIVARLSAQKAHHVLFEAFNLLLRLHPRARLVVVGGGEREGELHELASGLRIASYVRFTGNRRDVQALLPAFDVACLSSVHEGVPVTVIEAMAAGLPVVATDCGSLPDMITDGDQGFIVPVGDSAALAERLTTLAEDPELRRRQGDAARNRAEKRYSIVETTRGYEELLSSLVGAR